MSESLSEEELAELIRHGRINTSKSAARRRRAMAGSIINNKPNAQSDMPARRVESPSEAEPPKPSGREPDPKWLKAEKEKAERNIAAVRQERQRRDEMKEASRF